MDSLKTAVKTSVEAKVTDANALHSFTQDEVNAYCEHINYYLAVYLLSFEYLIIFSYIKDDVDL